jgi:hypothetical protein
MAPSYVQEDVEGTKEPIKETLDARVKRLLRKINKAGQQNQADDGLLNDSDADRAAILVEIGKCLPIMLAGVTNVMQGEYMAMVDTDLETTGFEGKHLCTACATCVSRLDGLALAALMQGSADELLDAHMRCRGRGDRWDAEFSGEMHESMLKVLPARSLARRQALQMVSKHGRSVAKIQKMVPVGTLYGPRGTDKLWVGNTNGWKRSTDMTSSLDRKGRDKIDAICDVFYHEYGSVHGYAMTALGPDEDESIQMVGRCMVQWLERKNEFDASMAQSPFTLVGHGTFSLCNKLMDCPSYFHQGRDGCEQGGIMSYLGAGMVHDAMEALGDLVQNEVGNWWLTGGLTAGVHALKLHCVVAAFHTVYSDTQTRGDGQTAGDWLWVLGNGRHRGYTCAGAAKTLCKGHRLSMQRAYLALAAGQSDLPRLDLEVSVKIRDDIVRLGAMLEEASLGEDEGDLEDSCLAVVCGISRRIANAREEGVPPEPLLDAVRVGLDAAFRGPGFWDMALGSLFYKGGHADLDKAAARELF